MKKILNFVLIAILILGLFVFTGCKDAEKNNFEETQSESDYIYEKDQTIIDRSNSKLKSEDDVKKEIEMAMQDFFERIYGDKVFDARYKNIEIYKGNEEAMKYVDLAENDYAFEIDYEIKPSAEKYVDELTEYFGKYDEESGWIIENHGYGVMRYNEISDEYDITSIGPNGF